MNKIRRGLDFISQMYPSDNPLAEKDFETDRLSLFLRESGLVYDISRGSGQIVLEDIVKEYMQRIERDLHGLPIKLYPFSGTGKPDEPRSILIDPKISFGRPILSNISIPVEIIVERYRAGESMGELAGDYECNQEKIEEAIRCKLWDKPPESITFFLDRALGKHTVAKRLIQKGEKLKKTEIKVKHPYPQGRCLFILLGFFDGLPLSLFLAKIASAICSSVAGIGGMILGLRISVCRFFLAIVLTCSFSFCFCISPLQNRCMEPERSSTYSLFCE